MGLYGMLQLEPVLHRGGVKVKGASPECLWRARGPLPAAAAGKGALVASVAGSSPPQSKLTHACVKLFRLLQDSTKGDKKQCACGVL